jgi:hypothetical protein
MNSPSDGTTKKEKRANICVLYALSIKWIESIQDIL